MNTIEQDKKRHNIIDWVITIIFIVLMIGIIFSMKRLMAVDKVLFISSVAIVITLFAYAKIKLAAWGKRLATLESDRKM